MKLWQLILILGLATLICGMVLATGAAAAGNTGYGAPRRQPEPAPAAQPAAAEEEEEGDTRSWLASVRLKFASKAYGLDEAKTEQLLAIQREEKLEKKRLELEIAAFLAELEEAQYTPPPPERLAEIFSGIKERKLALVELENRTFDRVHSLLGDEQTIKWVLAQRTVFQKMRGAVKRAAQRDEGDTSTPAPRRPSGPGGYGPH